MSQFRDPRDPPRLTDNPDDDSELAAAIVGLRSEHGSRAQVQALERRLSAKLGAAALSRTGPVAPATSPCAICVAALVAVLGAWFSASQLVRQAGMARALGVESNARAVVVEKPGPPRAAISSDDSARSSLSPPPSAAVGECPHAELAPARPQKLAAPAPSGVRHRHPSQPDALASRLAASHGNPDPAGELDLLRRAQAALRHQDSSEALELVAQHAHDYPHGVFAQEREVIAVAALLKRQKRPEALARARQFIARFGDSPYSFRLRSMIEQSPRAPAAVNPAS